MVSLALPPVLPELLHKLEGAVLDRVLGLPPASTPNVQITRGIRIPMPDGSILLADLYQPGIPDAPTVLTRNPYGRTGMVSRTNASAFSRRGFNVVIQSCRGTSPELGDTFDQLEPMVNEEKDGLATLDWLEEQPWYNGQLFMFGPSYVGFTPVALAVAGGPRVTGIVPAVTTSTWSETFLPGDTLFTAGLVQLMRRMKLGQRRPELADFVELTGDRPSQRAMWHLPLGTTDTANTGKKFPFYQRLMAAADDRADQFWDEFPHLRDRLGDIAAATHFWGGWHDFANPSQLRDYAAMRAAGREPYLTVGPWRHVDDRMMADGVKECLSWFRALADGTETPRTRPVRLYVQGAEEWRDFETFPPAECVAQQWFVQPGGGLTPDGLGAGAPRTFRYDPADPTPDAGGAVLDPNLAGRKDQTAREARADVLVYTGEVLDEPLELIGWLTAQIKVRTSSPYADIFVRLCDVDENGRSVNVCDGIQRTTGDTHPADADGIRTVSIDLWPTAFRFQPGHRLRIQICGGSFPRFNRNPGTGAPLATATTLVPVDFEILPGSGVTLPVMPTRQ